MMFASDDTEKACVLALQTIASHVAKVATDSSQSVEEKIKTLQWVYRKIPEINKLLVAINTKRINK